MKLLFIIGCLLTWLGLSDSLFRRECPHARGMRNFDPSRFMGVWYVQAEIREHDNIECQRVNFVRMPGRIGYYRDGIRMKLFGLLQIRTREAGLGRLAESGRRERRAELSMDDKRWFHDWVDLGQDPTAFVMATDYENYAIIYRCSDYHRHHPEEEVWLLTRRPIVPNSLRNYIYSLAFRMNLPTNRLDEVNHQTCRMQPSVHSFEYREDINDLSQLEIKDRR